MADCRPNCARHFTPVEIDQWFRSLFATGAKLPDPDTVERHFASVPDSFGITIKAHNAITLTHAYSRQPRSQERHTNEPNPYFSTWTY